MNNPIKKSDAKQPTANQPRGSGGRSSARRRAREFALQGLYQWLIAQESPGVIEAQLRDAQNFAAADQEHFCALLHGAIREASALRTEFARHIDRALSDLSPVEHAVLLVGAYELAHHPDIPYKVVINEAVELAKSFGGTDGFKYVNGVLDKVALSLRPVEVAARKN